MIVRSKKRFKDKLLTLSLRVPERILMALDSLMLTLVVRMSKADLKLSSQVGPACCWCCVGPHRSARLAQHWLEAACNRLHPTGHYQSQDSAWHGMPTNTLLLSHSSVATQPLSHSPLHYYSSLQIVIVVKTCIIFF